MSRVERIGDATLYLGDCREILPGLGKVDAVVTDPPYGVGLVAKQHKWFDAKGNGYASFEDTPDNVALVAVRAIEIAREIARSVCVTPGTECAWLYPKPDDIGSIFNASGTGSGKWGFKCSTPVLFYGKCPYLATGKGRRANSWQQPENDYSEKVDHPCPKPLGMMKWLVQRASLQGETVVDPFCGSGTTGVACAKLGRKFIGIEIEPKYFDIACERIAKAYAQSDLFITKPAPAIQDALL
jgi:site-specific DNA-methyltransferase (adenine-specific)